MSSLTKRQESLLRALSSRHGRKKSEYCFCDGLRSGSEILSLRPDLVELVILREGSAFDLEYPCEPLILSEKEFAKHADTVNSQGIIVIAKRPPPVPLDKPLRAPFALLLDRIGDPGNFGTIIRTARAAGLSEIWITRGTVDPFSDKTLRSASAAQFAVDIRFGESLQELSAALKQLGISRFYRTLPAGGENVFTSKHLFEQSAIILGAEANGAGELENSIPLNIPMPGTAESLNVAQAATIILFEYVRRTLT